VAGRAAGVEGAERLGAGDALVAEDPRGVGALGALGDLLEDEAVAGGADLANLVATGGVVHAANVGDTRAAHFSFVDFLGLFLFFVKTHFFAFFLKERNFFVKKLCFSNNKFRRGENFEKRRQYTEIKLEKLLKPNPKFFCMIIFLYF
jgi:hypothetical protein